MLAFVFFRLFPVDCFLLLDAFLTNTHPYSLWAGVRVAADATEEAKVPVADDSRGSDVVHHRHGEAEQKRKTQPTTSTSTSTGSTPIIHTHPPPPCVCVRCLQQVMLVFGVRSLREDYDRAVAMIVLGSLTFIPGSYSTYILYGAWRKWPHYRWDSVPSYDD